MSSGLKSAAWNTSNHAFILATVGLGLSNLNKATNLNNNLCPRPYQQRHTTKADY